MDTKKIELPEGWFDETSINAYRKLASAVPHGGTLVELGCWKGRSICSIADIIIAKKLNVTLVDSFTGYDADAGQYGDVESMDIEKELLKNLIRFGISNQVDIIKATTNEALGDVVDIDLLFIDADHTYEAVKADIENWQKFVVSGGTIAGHDFYAEGVNEALAETLDGVEVSYTVWRKKL